MNVNQALIMLRLKHVPDTPAELRQAYKEATSRWHPDKARVNGVSEQVASRNMSRVNQANALLRGVMRLRGESRLGRSYSDPLLGQHFPRDEHGYIADPSPLGEVALFLRGVILGLGNRESEGQVDRRPFPTDATGTSPSCNPQSKGATGNRQTPLLRRA